MTGSVAIAQALAGTAGPPAWAPMPWDAPELRFAVREPFPSKASQATLVFGTIAPTQPLVLVSRMPENGVIFSDGIEADRLDFNAGTVAIIGVADRSGQLVI